MAFSLPCIAETDKAMYSNYISIKKKKKVLCSVAKSCLPLLWPHGLHYAQLPCPSLSPWVCSNSCPLIWHCYPTISFSVFLFSSCPQSFTASGSFPMSQLFSSGGQSIGSFSFSISTSDEYSGLISLRIDWFDLPAVPWTARRSNQSILKGISPGCSLEGLMLKLKLPILCPPDEKSWLIWKDPDAGKDWGQEKGMTDDKMVGWHHQLNAHGFEWTPGVGDGQGGLACCSSWGRKESDTTEWLNWTEGRILIF